MWSIRDSIFGVIGSRGKPAAILRHFWYATAASGVNEMFVVLVDMKEYYRIRQAVSMFAESGKIAFWKGARVNVCLRSSQAHERICGAPRPRSFVASTRDAGCAGKPPCADASSSKAGAPSASVALVSCAEISRFAQDSVSHRPAWQKCAA
jgi:hypothetical protein